MAFPSKEQAVEGLATSYGFVRALAKRAKTPLRTRCSNQRVVEQGAWRVKRLRRGSKVQLTPWQAPGDASSGPLATADGTPPLTPPRGNPLALARFYQALLDSGKVESRAALARHLGVSRARVTQVLRRLRRPAGDAVDDGSSPRAKP